MGATFLLIFKVYLINSFFSLLTTSQLSLIFPRSTPGLGYLLLSPHLYTTTGLQPSLLPLLWYQFITPQLHQWCQHPAHYVCGYLVAHLCPTLCDPMDCSPPGSSVHGDSPGKNTGVGCHALFLGIFPIQGSNPGLPHCRQILYHLSHRGRGVLLPLLKNPPWVVLPLIAISLFFCTSVEQTSLKELITLAITKCSPFILSWNHSSHAFTSITCECSQSREWSLCC